MTIGYEQVYQLRTGDFDRYARLAPASVLDIFQDIAGVSAEKTPGMQRDVLLEKGVVWVVVRSMYEIVEQPDLHEQVIARTWPLAPRRMGFQRDYTIRALDGRLLVKSTSEWVMMDIKERSFVSARDVYDGPDDFAVETAFEKKLRRIRSFDIEGLSAHTVEPTFADIDVNGHVNNTKYANYVLDAIQPRQDQAIRRFQIDYHKEMHIGQRADVYVLDEGDAVKTAGFDSDANELFTAQVSFL